MSELSKVNAISEELAKIVRDAMPKKGQTIWFESVRPKGRGTTVKPFDRIWDPYLGKDGEYVDIAYIVGREPAKGPGGIPKDIHGRIQFTRSSYGRIGIPAGNKEAEQLFVFLFLTNQNGTNADKDENGDPKPWYVAGSPVIFTQDKSAQNAEASIEFDRLVRQAQDSIDRMDETKIKEIALGLDIRIPRGSNSVTETISALYKIAKKDPKKILGLDKDVIVKIRSEVRRAEKLNIVKYNTELKIWEWPESGDKICQLNPARGPVDSLVAYFMSSGGKTYKFMLELLERAERDPEPPKKKEEKASA